MFVCAMPYVLVPVVLQLDVNGLDDCVPDVFVVDVFWGVFGLYFCLYNVCLQELMNQWLKLMM